MAPAMKDEERYKLHFGPYYPPKVRRGSRLFDEVHGTVVVGRFSDGEIPWPQQHGKRSLVLCGDLVKAVQVESELAICHWWGVSKQVVARWRRALGVDKYTHGTRRLHAANSGRTESLERLARNRHKVVDPLNIARRARRRKRKGVFIATKRTWSDSENALLGTIPDYEIARRVGCSTATVGVQRRLLGITPFRAMSPMKNTLPLSPRKLLARRLELRLNQQVVEKRAGITSLSRMERGIQKYASLETVNRLCQALECHTGDIVRRAVAVVRTIPDDSLLGTMKDTDLAREWHVSVDTVRKRRVELGIESFRSRQRPPFPDESLLGTLPDKELAALWGMSWKRVAHRRRTLGIPAANDRWVVCHDKLRALRIQANMTQSQIAAQAGIAYTHYNDFERGAIAGVRKDTAKRLATALGGCLEDIARPLIAKYDGNARLEETDSSLLPAL